MKGKNLFHKEQAQNKTMTDQARARQEKPKEGPQLLGHPQPGQDD